MLCSENRRGKIKKKVVDDWMDGWVDEWIQFILS